MSAVNKDIYVLGYQLPIEQEYLGITTLEKAEAIYHPGTSALTIIDWDIFYIEADRLLRILQQAPSVPFPIFYVEESNLATLLARLEQISFSAIIFKSEPQKLQKHVLISLEKLRLKKQENELLALMQSQNQDLEELSQTLEAKQEEQIQAVLIAKEKVQLAAQRLEAIQRLIVALYTADSIGEMERLLLEALRYAIDLKQVKLLLSSAQWSDSSSESIYVLKLPMFYEEQRIGECLFVSNRSWSKSEEVWLTQITEMIAIAVDRWLSLERSSSMKENWEASFRSIQSKIAVIDENYYLLAHNQSAAFIREKCHKLLFNLEQPCYGCKLGKNFQITHLDRQENDLHIFDVKSQQQLAEIEDEVYVNVYEDVTNSARQGRERVEAAKLAELGLIGSSIAHELNNPLSGVLSYIQILLSEQDPQSEFYSILLQMEEGAKRCKQIIQNLLSFTRFSKGEEDHDFLLHKVIEKALLFIETKAKTLGVNITIEVGSQVVVYGNESLFLQALLEVMKNAMEEFAEILISTQHFRAQLTIRQSQNANSIILDIIDNGRGIPMDKLEKIFTPLFTMKNLSHNRGLGLTTAYQILQAMKGRIEIFSAIPSGVQVRMVMPAKTTSP